MNEDHLTTELLDLVIDYMRGAVNMIEMMTSIGVTVSVHGQNIGQDVDPEVGEAVFEIVEALAENEVAAVGVPLVLSALAASGGDYDRDRYEKWVDLVEAALLECYLDHDGYFLEALAVPFSHGLFTETRPLIARILYPFQTNPCSE